MTIISIILTTITSVINIGITIIALNGGYGASLANSSAGLLPRSITPLVFGLTLPIIFTFFILSFMIKSGKDGKKPGKSAKFLTISFGLTFLQALVSVVIYRLNYQTLTSYEIVDFNPLPLIINAIVTTAAFIGAIICSIKATSIGDRNEYNINAKVLAFVALGVGIFEFLLEVIPVIIFRIDRSNGIVQSMLQWTEELRMLNPAILAFAVVNTVKKLDKFAVIAWIGVLLAFSARIVLYLIAYV